MPEAQLRTWAVIPARGGSKGIPGKNLRLIQGRSLVSRAVEAARSARLVERVIVSTDDAAIARQARQAGADIVERPQSLSGDEASSESALLHVLDMLSAGGIQLPELIAFIQCTSPFVSVDDVDGTIDALLAQSADTAHTAAASHHFLWRQTGGGAEAVNHDKLVRPRRQDRQPEYIETGAVYVMRVAGFRQSGHRFFGKTVLHEVPSLRAMEIDTLEDLTVARILAPLIEPTVRRIELPDPLGAVVFDFDGVFTDDNVAISEDGRESVVCSRADGFGIELLRQRGIRMAVISRERNGVVAQRCRKLKLDCHDACDDKLETLLAICAQWKTPVSSVVYVGNDLPDIECIKAAGLGVAVRNAHPETVAAADLVLPIPGGSGAVRSLCELVLRALDTRGHVQPR